jgi:hypothetical protein
VYFRRIDGVPLNNGNSNLPPAADEGFWRTSKGLPEGSKILLSVNAAKAPADGRSVLRLHIEVYGPTGARLTSVGGAPVKLLLETTTGRFQVPGVASVDNMVMPAGRQPQLPSGQTTTELSSVEVILTQGQLDIALMAPTEPGDAKVRVSSGAVGVQGEVSFIPDLRPMMMVGIVEGSLNFSKLSKTDPNAPEIIKREFEDSLRSWTRGNNGGDRSTQERIAFFAKGTIKGEYLLTVAADSDKITREKLFRDVDPNQFYPIYGDASVKQYDARSTSRVYVRIDKDKSYILWGDYSTASNDTGNKLGSYSRTLTGGKWHYENQTVKINAFGSRETNRGYVDEQPGRGISGPYSLGKPNAVVNSEQVEILVRDRNAPAIVLRRQQLIRYVDYDFEPFSGQILFRQPVPSVDEYNNPTSIRIAYEVDEGGDKYWVAGVDGKVKIGDNVAIGGSYAQDKNPLAPYSIKGVNAEVRLGERTYVVAELAQSQGNQYVNQGITPALGTTLAAPIDQKGNAGRLEIRHDGQDLKGRAYIAKSDPTFQNPSAGLSPGRQEAGASVQLKISEQLSVYGDVLETKDNSGTLTNGARRDAVTLGATWKFHERFKLDLSLNHVDEKQVAGSGGFLSSVNAQQATLPGLGWGSTTSFGFGGTGLLASPSILPGLTPNGGSQGLVSNNYTSMRARLTGKVTQDLSLYGEYERATDERQRAAVGGEYRLDEKSRVYARHEFANSLTGTYGLTTDGSKSSSTIVGVDTAYMQGGQLFSEYRVAGTQSGQDVGQTLGVRNLWRMGEGFNVTTSFEQQNIRPALSPRQEATAVSLGAEYTANPLYKAGGKLEYRTSSVQQTVLSTLAYTRKLSDSWAGLARNLFMRQRATGSAADNGTQTQDRFQLGLAYRDVLENRYHALTRLEYRLDESSAVGNPVDSNTWIGSLHGIYHPSRPWTVSVQTAFKRVNERFGVPTGAFNANGVTVATLGQGDTWNGALLSGRVIWDFMDRFDASLYFSEQMAKGVRLRGIGGELGYRVMDNMWVSVGFTDGKYSDVDAFSANQSWRGWHLRLRYKFDEKSFQFNDPTVNKTLDPTVVR